MEEIKWKFSLFYLRFDFFFIPYNYIFVLIGANELYKKENSLSFNNSLIHWTFFFLFSFFWGGSYIELETFFFQYRSCKRYHFKKEKRKKNEMLILLERLIIYICVCIVPFFLLKDSIVPKTVYYNSYDKRDTRAEKYID